MANPCCSAPHVLPAPDTLYYLQQVFLCDRGDLGGASGCWEGQNRNPSQRLSTQFLVRNCPRPLSVTVTNFPIVYIGHVEPFLAVLSSTNWRAALPPLPPTRVSFWDRSWCQIKCCQARLAAIGRMTGGARRLPGATLHGGTADRCPPLNPFSTV
jgi:hypothetical protein